MGRSMDDCWHWVLAVVAVMAVMMLGVRMRMSSAGKNLWNTTWCEMQPACVCFSPRLGWLEALCRTVLVLVVRCAGQARHGRKEGHVWAMMDELSGRE